ncbi:MAG: hypothetical protein Q8L54_03995 [Devosia sp.]|nr:hypothetical protein [Devosia sp.]
MGAPRDGEEVRATAASALPPTHRTDAQSPASIWLTISCWPAAIAWEEKSPAAAPKSTDFGAIAMKATVNQNADLRMNM